MHYVACTVRSVIIESTRCITAAYAHAFLFFLSLFLFPSKRAFISQSFERDLDIARARAQLLHSIVLGIIRRYAESVCYTCWYIGDGSILQRSSVGWKLECCRMRIAFDGTSDGRVVDLKTAWTTRGVFFFLRSFRLSSICHLCWWMIWEETLGLEKNMMYSLCNCSTKRTIESTLCYLATVKTIFRLIIQEAIIARILALPKPLCHGLISLIFHSSLRAHQPRLWNDW